MIALALLLAAQPTPVYLACVFPRKESPAMTVEISLDEANQRAVVSLTSGRVVTRTALFSPEKVQIADEDMTWSISRVNLRIRRTASFMPPSDPGETGLCKVMPTPAERAF